MQKLRKISGHFCEYIKSPKSKFASKSFRWKQSGKAWLLIGCPKGKFSRNVCKVGTKIHAILVKTIKMCKLGGKSIRK